MTEDTQTAQPEAAQAAPGDAPAPAPQPQGAPVPVSHVHALLDEIAAKLSHLGSVARADVLKVLEEARARL